ncbi:MAG TPA: hypothetical protein VK618_05245 [Flavitalea sp.]|nr:hypothetical protein [Flavitalea sp.]
MEYAYLSLTILLLFLGIVTAFFFYQYHLLNRIKVENRMMRPGYVWLQLIPLFGLYWQFRVVTAISKSIYGELESRLDKGSLIFNENDSLIPKKPAYTEGIIYCILVCASLIPIQSVKIVTSVIGIGAWIRYIIVLRRFERRLKNY